MHNFCCRNTLQEIPDNIQGMQSSSHHLQRLAFAINRPNAQQPAGRVLPAASCRALPLR
jgi:hypothetical protein